ncbi:unnamed protein product [Ectocarpus sp. 8 AP-2014]
MGSPPAAASSSKLLPVLHNLAASARASRCDPANAPSMCKTGLAASATVGEATTTQEESFDVGAARSTEHRYESLNATSLSASRQDLPPTKPAVSGDVPPRDANRPRSERRLLADSDKKIRQCRATREDRCLSDMWPRALARASRAPSPVPAPSAASSCSPLSVGASSVIMSLNPLW